MHRENWIAWTATSFALLSAAQAHAHFRLLQPASWLDEDSLGGPQKGSPCGPGNTRPFIGDDVQPIPASNAVTSYHAGETVTVKWQETVYHPGYFRISWAKTHAAAATMDDFPNPALTDATACYYDKSAVQTVPHDNVLADGLFMVDDQAGTGRSLMADVTLPDEPCDDCTLQVVQVMEAHGAASCYYFHCADIEILPAEGGSADAGSSPDASVAMPGKGGQGATKKTTPASAPKRSGCSIADAHVSSWTSAGWLLAALGLAAALRTRRRQRTRYICQA